MNNQSANLDTASILSELREQVKERRARFTYTDAEDPHALNLDALRKSADAVNDTWFVSAHLPVTWDLPVVGRLGSYTKRLVRILLRWYINPIVEQQNRFNSSVARAIVEITAYQERMAREWQLLEERVERLEAEEMKRET